MQTLLYGITFLLLTTTGVISPGAWTHSVNLFPDTVHTALVPSDSAQAVADTGQEKVLVPTIEKEEDYVPVIPKPTPLVEKKPVIASVLDTVETVIKPVEKSVNSYLEKLIRDTDEDLHVAGILAETNQERIHEGLPSYKLQPDLTRMAELKLADMLAQDYFAHVSPDGVDISALAQKAGYEYLLVGENLAYGNFKDNHHVVDAWMNSPGHRANIMHEKFTEIGIAVEEAYFQGDHFWIAVQEFGLPRGTCGEPDKSLLALIENLSDDLKERGSSLEEFRDELESTSPSSPGYADDVEEFQALVERYNELVGLQREYIADYNRGVKTYNKCLDEAL